MVGKQGYLRVFEALIAGLIVLGVIFVVAAQNQPEREEDLTNILPPLLDEIAKNLSLRLIIISYDLSLPPDSAGNLGLLDRIRNFIRVRLDNPSLGFDVRLCRITDVCFLEPYPRNTRGELYTFERGIGTSVFHKELSQRKLKIFLWRKD